MGIDIGVIRLDHPVILAPMSGVTDLPFRRLVKRLGAGLVVSEMIASQAMIRQTRQSLRMSSNTPEEFPMAVQLAGCEPGVMAEAARLNADRGAALIDINFGCPVKKVVRRNGGSGCLRDLGLTTDIIAAVRGATKLPVTVKTRSGWDEPSRDPVRVALTCQEAGAQVLTLHPRTRAQMYRGEARWSEIKMVVDALDIPVVGNGDVQSCEDAARLHEQTGCAGIMIARGSFGNPWIFQQTRNVLNGHAPGPTPEAEERFAVALRHAGLALNIQGDDRRTALEFRKHLGWYTRGLPGAAQLRQQLHQIETMSEADQIFHEYLEPSHAAA